MSDIQALWWNIGLSKYFKKRRLQRVIDVFGDFRHDSCSILDVGCANGKDLVQYLKDYPNLKIFGIDPVDYGIRQDNFQYIKGIAEELPFEDKSIDYVVSMGLLEHIEPVENLCRAISEIERVAKNYCVIIPAVNTPLEPHTKAILWQLRDRNHKKQYKHAGVNYYSDDTWTKFAGFIGARTKRFWYIPGVICDLIIYKLEKE